MAVEVEAHKVLFATTLMLVERGELQGTGVLCWWEVGGGADRLPGREAGGRQAGRLLRPAVTLASESESEITNQNETYQRVSQSMRMTDVNDAATEDENFKVDKMSSFNGGKHSKTTRTFTREALLQGECQGRCRFQSPSWLTRSPAPRGLRGQRTGFWPPHLIIVAVVVVEDAVRPMRPSGSGSHSFAILRAQKQCRQGSAGLGVSTVSIAREYRAFEEM